MPNLSILNTLIAMVIVILVLSLVVQSIQTLVKKLFKVKSNTILNSLEDLFLTITQSAGGADAAADGVAKLKAKQLVEGVTGKLRQMGRETLMGRPMFDSLSKGDLLKVLTRVEAENLLPGAVGALQTVLTVIAALNEELKKITDNAGLLEGDASAKFATLKAALLPVLDDIGSLASDGKINPKVMLGDLYRLRQVRAADALAVLGEVQKRVGEDLAAARAAGAAGDKVAALEGISGGLNKVAEQIVSLDKAFDAALVPLRERVEQAAAWYDTVMQGFEERYTRHMRTVAILISIVVVVVLNANFFTIYQAMKNPETAERVAGQGQGVLERQEREPNELVDTYKSFGLAPLTRKQVSDFFAGRYRARDVSGTFFGWFIMVMLLSAGAPFWQDTLESLFGLKNLLRQKSDTKNVEGERGGQPRP
ncbi:MAG TPA: hypothetical protein VF736_09895 [Pyrinomonadaceae bacterium]|jgi:hypothetical protein